MSFPKNPLDPTTTYGMYNVLAAFEYTKDAENAILTAGSGKEGASVSGAGPGMIIVNDFVPSRFEIVQYSWTFNYDSIFSVSTSMSYGQIILSDRNTGNFLNFVHDVLVPSIGVSVENMTFALRTYWIDSESSAGDRIKNNPIIFSVPDITHSMKKVDNFYSLGMVGLFNTKSQIVNYSRLYNMSITHEEGNLHKEMPRPDPQGGSIMPRGAEDGIKEPKRKERIDKSKPMKTLDDVFKALQKELDERKFIHDGQLQEWQSFVRDDYVKKLKVPPEQTHDYPVFYRVDLDDVYKSYPIDNRNLPFEQPEQKQFLSGIRVIPAKFDESIIDIVDKIMSMSKKVGEDAEKEPFPESYKITTSWERLLFCDKVEIVVKIRKYQLPKTREDLNTGPGESAIDPLTFYFKRDSNAHDVLDIDGRIAHAYKIDIVEENDENIQESRVAYAQRENITAERLSETGGPPFYETGFNGYRAFLRNDRVIGVEYPKQLASWFKSKHKQINTENTSLKITIRGNPLLFSDVCRQVTDTAQDSDGNVTYYRKPENFPLYAKLHINFSIDTDDVEFEETSSENFYHTNYMHLYRIDNIMIDGAFYQELYFKRTDTYI